MSLVEMEPGLAAPMSGGPMERPNMESDAAVVIELLGEGYAIERDPKPVASIVAQGVSAEAVLQRLSELSEGVAGREGQDEERFTPYALTGEPEEIYGGITGIGGDAAGASAFIRKLIGSVERPSDEEAADLGTQHLAMEAGQPEKKGFGHNALRSVRRSRFGMHAATTITAATAFFAAHTESAKAKAQTVNPIIAFDSGINYLDGSTSPVPIGAVPGEPTDPGGGGSTSPGGGASSGAGSETAPTDPAEVRRNCVDVALTEPRIVNAEVLHAGNFDVAKGHTQSWSLSVHYRESMPEYCHGLYGQGNKAKAQAFHDGHWVNEGVSHSVVIVPENNSGSWEDIGNVKQVYFPVCSARILLKATSSDLSRDTGKAWAPHPIIASRTFPPIPVKKILPHKPKGC